MEKSVDVFLDPTDAQLYIVNENDPSNTSNGLVSTTAMGASVLQQSPGDIKSNGVIVQAGHDVRGARGPRRTSACSCTTT